MRDTQREAESQAEGEAGSMQGARRGTHPRTPESCPGPKAGAKPLSHPGIPRLIFFMSFDSTFLGKSFPATPGKGSGSVY